MNDIKVLAFDVFGTVFDLSNVDKGEIRNYVKLVHGNKWVPLRIPESWEGLSAHPDAVEGIARLRRHYTVVTLSNCPLASLVKLSRANDITWDAIIPIELKKVYKPNLEAYRTVYEVLDIFPDQVMMVTANKTFGDLEAADCLGMRKALVRDTSIPEGYKDVNHLAQVLGC